MTGFSNHPPSSGQRSFLCAFRVLRGPSPRLPTPDSRLPTPEIFPDRASLHPGDKGRHPGRGVAAIRDPLSITRPTNTGEVRKAQIGSRVPRCARPQDDEVLQSPVFFRATLVPLRFSRPSRTISPTPDSRLPTPDSRLPRCARPQDDEVPRSPAFFRATLIPLRFSRPWRPSPRVRLPIATAAPPRNWPSCQPSHYPRWRTRRGWYRRPASGQAGRPAGPWPG